MYPETVRGPSEPSAREVAHDYRTQRGGAEHVVLALAKGFPDAPIYNDWRLYVRQDPQLMRPAEVDILLGDPAKAEEVLGWKREIDFPGLVGFMVAHDIKATDPNH